MMYIIVTVENFFAGEKPQMCGVWKSFCGAKWSKKMQACFVSEMFSTRISSPWIDQFAWNLPNLKDDQLEDLEEQVFLLTYKEHPL